ncbi:hypothetical protein Zmor_009481 [Zophobas morio]|uniref:Uncharacterized protein n=1 Tax=Zophobas morio TaxID=2755281 RepID=A0AA38IMJ3_9CUCU|nr:hypothetical protein Zmor_009481 [Zophobas morio]
MSKNNCCTQSCVSFLIFFEMLLAFLILYVFLRARANYTDCRYPYRDDFIQSDEDSEGPELRITFVAAFLLLTVSSLLLLFGVIGRHPKPIVAHLVLDALVIILIMIFLIMSALFLVVVPLGLMCGLNFGVLVYYRGMVAENRQPQANTYELCNTPAVI